MAAGKNGMAGTGARLLRDLAYGVALLTRIPVPMDLSGASARGGAAAWGWPVAGMILALICGLFGWALAAAGLPAGLVAGLVLAGGFAPPAVRKEHPEYFSALKQRQAAAKAAAK